MESVQQVAARTGLSDRRVRALIADGALAATKVGASYVLDERDVDGFLRRERPAHTRTMAPRTAWGAAALADGILPAWLRSDERSRLRSRMASTSSPGAWQTWTTRLAGARVRFRASAEQVEAVLADPATVRSGRSATNGVSDPLVGTASAEVWVSSSGELDRLRTSLGLLRSASGNVTITVPSVADLPTLGRDGQNAYRLVVARDLLGEGDPRAASAGTALLRAVIADARALRA